MRFGRMALGLWIAAAVSAAERPVSAGPDEWTRFRGPNGVGISLATTIPATWTDKDYNWKVTLPGKGNSSPVLWGGQIFVTSGEPRTAKRTILGLRASDGGVLWQRDYTSRTFRQNRDNSYATSTPAVDRDQVYVYWTTPEAVTVTALDHRGQEVWQRDLGPFTAQHGSGTSPIVYDELVIVNNDQEGKSSLIALDRRTGRTRWEVERPTGKTSYATPCLLRPDQGPVELIFTSSSQGITSLDPHTGKANWELPDAFPARVVGSAVSDAGLVISSCGEGGVGRRLVAVRPGTPTRAPQLVYELRSSVPSVPTPVAKDGELFLWADNGVVTANRTATGQRLWQQRINDRFYSSPVWIDGRLYGTSKSGVMYVLATTDQGRLLATVDLGEPSFATPAVAQGVLYLRTESHLFSLGGKHL